MQSLCSTQGGIKFKTNNRKTSGKSFQHVGPNSIFLSQHISFREEIKLDNSFNWMKIETQQIKVYEMSLQHPGEMEH